MSGANAYRGECSLEVGGETLVLRPSFAALVAAEEELGSLFELVEQAAAGQLGLQQIVALFDHLSKSRVGAITRERIGEAVVELGLAKITPVLRAVLSQVLQGR
ncbi:GTA-gp10 family protein [Sphingomonas sp.]|uniref:GTA-gp10 family protein n=1 Tax=Sphingomonas sp. TaxID=28214 RepID=UPI0025EDDD23|nr:GTA-gp10 family protein [Sphingomonas sp.]MBV9529253.1 gene transfer agent family protein [Sphingomonas sp.]